MSAAMTTQIDLDQVTTQIITYKQVAATSILEIGRLLIQAKEALPHGSWGAYLRDRVDFSERQAQNFMRVAREYAANPQLVADLSLRKAIALLDVPAEEREAFAAEHDAAHCSTRELEAAIRDRDQAREERDQMEASLGVANASLAGAQAELAQTQQALEELKARPVEVAVETVVDEAAVKRAAKEAKAKAEAKAKKERDKLERQLQESQAKAEQLAKALEQAQAGDSEADQLREQLTVAQGEADRLRRELTVAANTDVSAVEVCFESIKSMANTMQGHILRLKAKGQTAEWDKCRRAMEALGQMMVRAAKEE